MDCSGLQDLLLEEGRSFLGLFPLQLLSALELAELHAQQDHQADDACPEESEIYVHRCLIVRDWREDVDLCPSGGFRPHYSCLNENERNKED